MTTLETEFQKHLRITKKSIQRENSFVNEDLDSGLFQKMKSLTNKKKLMSELNRTHSIKREKEQINRKPKKFDTSPRKNGSNIGPKVAGSLISSKSSVVEDIPEIEEDFPCDDELQTSNYYITGKKTLNFSLGVMNGTFTKEIAIGEDNFWREERGDHGEPIIDRIFGEEENKDSKIDKKEEIQTRTKSDIFSIKTPLQNLWGKKDLVSILKKKDPQEAGMGSENRKEVKFNRQVEVKKIEKNSQKSRSSSKKQKQKKRKCTRFIKA